MYVCACNNITQENIEANASLKNVVGNKCGKCLQEFEFEYHDFNDPFEEENSVECLIEVDFSNEDI